MLKKVIGALVAGGQGGWGRFAQRLLFPLTNGCSVPSSQNKGEGVEEERTQGRNMSRELNNSKQAAEPKGITMESRVSA